MKKKTIFRIFKIENCKSDDNEKIKKLIGTSFSKTTAEDIAYYLNKKNKISDVEYLVVSSQEKFYDTLQDFVTEDIKGMSK